MLTLLPALLVICGRWVFWPLRPTYGSDDHTETSLWARVGRGSPRGRGGPGSSPASCWRSRRSACCSSTPPGCRTSEHVLRQARLGRRARRSWRSTSRPAPATRSSWWPSADAAGEVSDGGAGVDGIAEVAEPVDRGGVAYIEGTLTDAADTRGGRGHRRPGAGRGARVPGRRRAGRWRRRDPADTLEASDRDNQVIIPLILLVVVLLILALLLRAVVAPLILVGDRRAVVRRGAGISALVFRHVFGFAGADPSLPLFVFVFLVALGHRLQHLPDDARARGVEGSTAPGAAR